jgi:Zn-dependent peptidase ImmA (M78 family)
VSRVPSRELSEARARKVYSLFGYSHPRDIEPHNLAMALNLVVIEAKLDTADARLVCDNSRGIIRLNVAIPEPGRKRFAVCHEIGHWLMHRKVTQLMACTSQDMVAKYKASPEEVEASYFAAELLMPEALVRKRFESTQLSKPSIESTATEFGTTFTATAIRCVDVSEDCCALVVSEQGRIKWWRGSGPFEERLLIDSDSILRSGTGAYELLKGSGGATFLKKEVSLELWAKPKQFLSEELEDEELSDYLIEESFYDSKYNRIVSVLFIP